ncbi:hypothetical protein Pfo_022280 [Paulownia fortunei]|nr:hypothetical protein Pfo_022280 [Paulownia fortunei]
MQTYPCGGHKEHCHKVVEEDYKFKDDYSGHGSHKEHCGHKEHCHKVVEEDYTFKDDYQYHNKGSSMQMKPDQCNPQPKHNYNGYGSYDQKKYQYSEEDYQYYNKGSSMQVKPGQSNPPPKDNYNGYGGCEQKKYQCSETCYQKGHDTCKSKNDYSGHGGKHLNAKESHSVGLSLDVGLLKGLLNPLGTTASVTLSKESSHCGTGK